MSGGSDPARHCLPPFDLTADMLFALALCPTPPLRRAFPGVPFISGNYSPGVSEAAWECRGSLGLA